MTSLVVRLPNHLGDACMTPPALQWLHQHGHALTLAGRPWARALFEAYAWPTIALAGPMRERVRLLRSVHNDGGAAAVLMTNSFRSALEFRLAGYRSIGYARGGRSFLLDGAVPVHQDDHMVEYYFRLAQWVSPGDGSPDSPSLRVSAAAVERAQRVLQQSGVDEPYVVICPVAIGSHRGQVKAWSGFGRLATELADRGHRIVAMPGPKETAAVRVAIPSATVLPESDVATFAALLAGAKLVLANDSGAGHLAASVGARLLSVFGVTDMEKTRPRSPLARLVGSSAGWPRYEDVLATTLAVLAD